MKKQLFLIVSVAVLALSCVVIFIVWQTGGLKKTISVDTQNSYYLFSKINQIDESTRQIQILIAETYLTKIVDDVDYREKLVQSELAKVKAELSEIDSLLSDTNKDDNLNIKDGETETQFKVGEAKQKLTAFYTKLENELQALFNSRRDQIETLKQTAKERNQLSRTFRDAFSLSRIDEEIYKKISRASLTVLFSNSNGDLNFSGRTIFEDATKDIANKRLSPEQKEKWEKLSVQFLKTYEVAFKASSFANDFEVFNQNLKEPLLISASLKGYAEKHFKKSKDQAIDTTDFTRSFSILVGALAGLISLTLGFIISKRLLNELRAMMNSLSKANQDINTASNSLTNTSSQLSSGASRSAASLEETLASLTEISSIIQVNVESAQSSYDLALQSASAASLGKEKVENLASNIGQLSVTSKKINEIVTVIDDIAFQTNLLALNAAVEAARAGEHGKGFAIVADAVRSLAMKSASAAKEIETLIKSTTEQINKGVIAVEDSQKVLLEIVQKVEQLKDKSEAIATSSKEQAAGIEVINSSLNELDTVSQTNAVSAQKTAEDSQGLTNQSQSLTQVVSDLEDLVGKAS
jgi:methyl-accepting chemotaxis protein